MIKIVFITLTFFLTACTARPANNSVTDSLKPIAEVLANHTSGWMNIPGVTGTGEGEKDGKPAILIFVDSLTDNLKSQLPVNIEGYPVVIEADGRVRPLQQK